MNSSQFGNAVTIIGGLTGLGVFLDQILTTQEARDKVHAFLQSRNRVPSSKAFFDYLGLVYEAVFMRFYGERVFSVRYAFSCLVTSVLSVVVVFAAQLYLFGSPIGAVVHVDALQVKVVIACVLANAFIDWLTISQTQTFFSIAISQKSVGRAVLLIVSDIIVTTNLFILLYSVVMAAVVWAARPIHEGKVKLEARVIGTDAPLRDLPEGWDKIFKRRAGDDASAVRLTLPVTVKAGDEKPRKVLLEAFASDETITLTDIVQISSALEVRPEGRAAIRFRHPEPEEEDGSTEGTVAEDSVKPSARPKDRPADLVVEDRGSPAWKEANASVELTEWQSATVVLKERRSDLAFDPLYTAAFVHAEQLELNFPYSVLGPISAVPVSSIMAQYRTYSREPAYAFGCFADGAWQVSTVAEAFPERCEKTIAVDAAGMASLGRAATKLLGWSSPLIPLNTLFLTSLTITIMAYLYAIFLLASRLISWVFAGWASRTERYFLKAPLACMGFIAGVLAVLYYVYVVGSF